MSGITSAISTDGRGRGGDWREGPRLSSDGGSMAGPLQTSLTRRQRLNRAADNHNGEALQFHAPVDSAESSISLPREVRTLCAASWSIGAHSKLNVRSDDDPFSAPCPVAAPEDPRPSHRDSDDNRHGDCRRRCIRLAAAAGRRSLQGGPTRRPSPTPSPELLFLESFCCRLHARRLLGGRASLGQPGPCA